MAKDHYEVLGVTRDATVEEIKVAYRRLARELHPDTNPDPNAHERFKEVSHAYDVLSDDGKRSHYDRFGDARAGAGVGDFGDFGSISDIFSTFFGGAGPRGGSRGSARGTDLLAEVVITLEDAATGVNKDVEISTLGTCEDCTGNGAAPGTSPITCSTCGGAGQVRQVQRSIFGDVMTAATCPKCSGTGNEIPTPCPACRGKGRVPVADTITIQLPAGIDDGARLKVAGRGEAGVRGASAGDLYVQIRVEPHEIFQRGGDDLACEVRVPFTIATLGGVVQVPTLEDPEEIEVSPGTQSGEIIRLKARGMPRLNGRGRGTLVAVLKIETPTDLDAEQVDLIARLAEMRGEEAGSKGFFEKFKQAFR
ncbi:MAG: molecular chaperone DnaJ [Actinobacteria bacterium]|nr:molecular chaperone DnaJ [Actinomycetota bacterium]